MAITSGTDLPPTVVCPRLIVRRIDALPDAESAFVHMYGVSRNAFWLDSSAPGQRGRFSLMGDSEGPLGTFVSYDVEERRVRVEGAAGVEFHDESIFDYLDRELRRLRPLSEDLPFDFDCGFAGYFGYEMKAECGGNATSSSSSPDAAFVFADRLLVFDRQERCTYLLCLTTEEGETWIEETVERLESLPPLGTPEPSDGPPAAIRLRRSRQRYLGDIATCKRYLTAGDSYEICLTNTVLACTELDPLALYRGLRQANPAPFSAYLRFGDLAVLSSSPERFLAVDRDGWAESRPIKGTSERGGSPEEDARLASTLRADEKSRAENVTIVDLVRNDLGRVCEVGTVSAPELMQVETYETVHQLVSAVRGRMRGGLGVVDCVRACFPPGSMTGAPKLRTMEIIDELEGEARGVYSGAIGYLGLGGACDLSVAIRTIVIEGESVAIGAGGAIVVDSDPEAEFEEMLLKARTQVAALAALAASPTGPAGPVAFSHVL